MSHKRSGKMKRSLCVLLLLVLTGAVAFAGGRAEKAEAVEGPKVLRVADSIPGKLTPGTLEGTCLTAVSALWDFLVRLDPETGELMPDLATSWSTDDGTVWTINLQKGVTFHDGTSFTAEDAMFTIERTQDPDLGHVAKWNFVNVEKMEKLNDHSFKVYLSDPSPAFMFHFAEYNMAVVSSEYDYMKLGDMQPMGTGPFKLVDYVPRESILLQKFENYWREGLPKVDELQIFLIADSDRKIAMLEGDQIDLVKGGVSPLVLQRLLKNPNFKTVPSYQTHRIFNMNMAHAPFDDNRVRQALKYTIDPEKIAGVAYGQLDVDDVYLTESPLTPKLSMYNNEISLRRQNIEKAKQLLAEAGYPNGFSTKLHYASDLDSNDEIAQAFKEMAAPAGINIELRGMTRDVYLSEYWNLPGLGLTAWNIRPEPSSMLGWGYRSDGSWNESSLNIPRMDEIIDALQQEIDPVRRQELYDEMQWLLYNEGTLVAIALPFNLVMHERVVNYREAANMLTEIERVDIAD
jgi:peptide/nickel transport system substrate-binding protein